MWGERVYNRKVIGPAWMSTTTFGLVPEPFKDADNEPEDQQGDRRDRRVAGEDGRAFHFPPSHKPTIIAFARSRIASSAR